MPAFAAQGVVFLPFSGTNESPHSPGVGWRDVTECYFARYDVPKAGTAIWIRPCQHIDGWADVPKVVRARVPAPAP